MELDVAQKVSLRKTTHSVRASQAVLQYGVGAMVDFPDQTLMTAAPEYWREGVVPIHDERLEKALHVDFFGMPGSKDDVKTYTGISYARFPEWYFCPKCRKFQPIKKWIELYKSKSGNRARSSMIESDPSMVKHMKCPDCMQDLVVARIITACEDGHIDDFPWEKWVHCQNVRGGKKDVCENPTLTFKTGTSSAEGLEGLWVTCTNCNASASLKGAFDSGKFEQLDKETQGRYDFTCSGRHPWKNRKEVCDKYPKVLQRGSSSVYFPVTVSSLVIPPYSSLITAKVQNSNAYENRKNTLALLLKMSGLTQEMRDQLICQNIQEAAKDIAIETGIAVEHVKSVLERKWRDASGDEYTVQSVKYKIEEYEALTGEVSLDTEDAGEFKREATNISEYGLPYIKGISLIHKVREVQALIGFSRLKPADKSEPYEQQGRIVSIKEHETNWYPAYEVRGEGIFIEFDSAAINHWRNENEHLQYRIGLLNDNYKKSFVGQNNPRNITSKFVLLHTIAHMLIKQLSFECGYSIASLKERIYCSEAADGKEMNGIFIYTASGDTEGTMGGLVRQGRSDTFPNVFKKAIKEAMICSNDPVCSLSQGQGRESLNLAACYSCSLIPETSCEEFNIFLDRGMVVGTFNDEKLAFFYNQLYGNESWEYTKVDVVNNTSDTDKELVLLPGNGTDMCDDSYENIWQSLLDWAEDDSERALLEELLSRGLEFNMKEKPIQNCQFVLSDGTSGLKCELLWKKSQVAYFESDNDDYHKAVKTNWKCFKGGDKDLTVDMIIAAIEEK